MLRNLFKNSTIFVLFTFTLLLFPGKTYSYTEVPNEKNQMKAYEEVPEWVIQLLKKVLLNQLLKWNLPIV